MNYNPPFPLNPSPGQTYKNWTWNGTNWACQGWGSIVQTFTGSGQYFPSPGMTFALVETVGGGAAGGGVEYANAQYSLSGGGGGAGGYSRKMVQPSMVAGGVVVTIGAGGAASTGYGGDGGATTFGALCVANGGKGGGLNTGGLSGGGGTGWGNGGLGASTVGAVGDLVSGGNAGGSGPTDLVGTMSAILVWGGMGAGGPWGGAGSNAQGAGGNAAWPGAAGTGPGASGSGAVANTVTIGASQAGGAGAAGICIVTEYCLGPFSGDDCGGGARVGLDWCG